MSTEQLVENIKVQTGLTYTIVQWILVVLGVVSVLYLLVRVCTVRFESKLALRNIIRNKRRSFITLLAISSACAGNILLGNYFLGLFWGLREDTINSQTGHIQIIKKDFLEKGVSSPADYLIYNYDEIISALQSDDFVSDKTNAFTTRLRFSGLLTNSSGQKSLNYIGQGTGDAIGQGTDDAMFSSFDIYVEGTPLKPGDTSSVVLGEGLARQLEVNVDDYVTVMAIQPGGGFDILDANIQGIISPMSIEYGNVLLKANKGFAEELMGVQGTNRIILLLNETVDTVAVKHRIEKIIAQHPQWEVEVYHWYELVELYQKVLQMFQTIFKVVSSILFMLMIFLVLNTMTMSIYERFNEFGTLRSIGLKRRQLLSLIMVESLMLGILGVLIGIAIAWLTGQIILLLDITTPPPPTITRGYTLDLRTKFDVPGATLIFVSTVATVGTTLVSAIIPSYKAMRLKIINCLRYN